MFFELLVFNLPSVINIWTIIILCWGVLIGINYASMVNWTRHRLGYNRLCDVSHLLLILSTTTALGMYLGVSKVTTFVGGSILVVDVFYTAFLIESTFEIMMWMLSRHRYNLT
jgi:hypothetical protein